MRPFSRPSVVRTPHPLASEMKHGVRALIYGDLKNNASSPGQSPGHASCRKTGGVKTPPLRQESPMQADSLHTKG